MRRAEGRSVRIEIADGELAGGADAAPADTRHHGRARATQEALVGVVAGDVVADHAHVRLVEAKDGVTVGALLVFNME